MQNRACLESPLSTQGGRLLTFIGCHFCGQRKEHGPPFIERLHVLNYGCEPGKEITACTPCAEEFHLSIEWALASDEAALIEAGIIEDRYTGWKPDEEE